MAPSKKPAVNDPLEAAKMGQAKPLPPPPAAAPAPAVIVPPAPAEAPSPASPPPVPAGKVKRYRVKVRTTVSLQGQMTVLPAGSEISAESYGDLGLASILAQNVPVEEL